MGVKKRDLVIAFAFFVTALFLTLTWKEADTYIKQSLTTVQAMGYWGPPAFLILFIVATVLLAPSVPFVIAAGFLFGPVVGTLYALSATLVSASVSFWIARRLGAKHVERILPANVLHIHELQNILAKGNISFVLLIRLLVPIPFGIFNYSLGLSGMSYLPFLVGTFFGTAPWIVAYICFGQAITSSDVRWVALGLLLCVAVFIGIQRLRRHQIYAG